MPNTHTLLIKFKEFCLSANSCPLKTNNVAIYFILFHIRYFFTFKSQLECSHPKALGGLTRFRCSPRWNKWSSFEDISRLIQSSEVHEISR
jgi:hypothetical protein